MLFSYPSKAFPFVCLAAGLVCAMGACSSHDVTLGTNSSASEGSACASAGGTCLPTGGSACGTHAADGAQDCNPDELPSGPFCCLSVPASDSGATDSGAIDSGATGTPDATPPADGGTCTWPTALEPLGADASTAECSVARDFLGCTGSNGVGESCLSNDPSQCPGPNVMPGVTFTCMNRCASDQYAVACGFGPGPAPSPPSGCTSFLATPGGTEFFCCPCGS